MNLKFLRCLLPIAGLTLLLFCRNLPAQSISGVINSYAKVLLIDTCDNSLIIDNTSGFAPGDRVLLIQMKGATIDASNTASFGTITDMASAGDYEFTNIGTITGLTVTLQFKISKRYDVAASVQLVRVPQYTDATVTDLLTAKPWDGNSGGVLVLEASGTLTLKDSVSVSGEGFHGGKVSNRGTGDSFQDYFYPVGPNGAYKGEGIARLILNKETGRGPQATGGGGGNTSDAGGGGGGNGGGGGKGGLQNDPFAQLDIGGLGGRTVDYNSFLQRLIMGGGGGGGNNSDDTATAGAPGGGIIIIRADSIDGGNQVIIANGKTADTAGVDGAGGGGAGGSIVLSSRATGGQMTLIAQGGNGGCNNASFISAQKWCYAPGGGAGGGRVFVSSATPPVADVSGGKAGVVTYNALPCFGTSYGATDGTTGVINTGFVPFDSKIIFTYPKAISTLDTVCEGDSITIGINGGSNFSWTPSNTVVDPTSATPKVFPSKNTTYTATYLDDRGCPHSDSIVVIVNPHPQIVVTGPDSICAGELAKYVVTTGPGFPSISYQWTATDGTIIGTPTIDTLYVQWGYTASGSVTVTATPQGSPCDASVTLPVKINTGVRPDITGAQPICEGDTITLTASTGYLKYLWSTGDTSQAIRVDSAGKYFVIGTPANGCALSSDTVDIIVYPKLAPVITPWLTMMPDSGGFDTLFVGSGYKTYNWSTGKVGDTLVILDSGTYFCTVTDSNGCVGIASINIPRDSLTVYVDVGTDTILADPGDIVNFPVRLIRSKHLPPSGATKWLTTFTFNRTLMAPKDNTLYPSYTVGRWRTLTFDGNRPDPMEQGVMLPVDYIVTLGDTTETPIIVETFAFTNGRKTYVTRYNGLLRIRTCAAGGTRLFSDSSKLLLSQNHPNPASEITTIGVDLREVGHTELILCDMLGRKVKTIINGEYKAGHLDFTVDVSDLPRGKYVYVLQTPSAVRSRILEIER